MVTKSKSVTKESTEKAKAHWQCTRCGSDFWGAKKNPRCPQCQAEGFDLKELNEDGLPIGDVKHVLSGGVDVSYDGDNTVIGKSKPAINIDLTRAAINRADEMGADLFEREMDTSMQDIYLSRAKAKAAEAKVTQTEQEKRLRSMSQPNDGEMDVQGPPNTNYLSASTLIQSISTLPEEEREWWLGQIKDPQTVYGLATLLNPPKQTMQGNVPFQQMNNPLMNLMGMRQQMMDQQPPHMQQNQGGEETSSMLELAQAFKILQETAVASIPKQPDSSEANRELKEALNELKESQDKLNDKYLALRIEQVEGSGGGVTREDIESIINTKMQALNKGPKEMLREIKETITEVDDLRQTIEVKNTLPPIHSEPLEEWVKKHTLERELVEEKMRHEEAIASDNAKTEKWKVAKILLSDGIKENIKARTKDGEEESEEEISVPASIKRSKVTLVK